jgi:hypothetical protein
MPEKAAGFDLGGSSPVQEDSGDKNGFPGWEAILQQMQYAHCLPSPWVPLRRDQLIPVNNKVVGDK